MKSLFSLPVAHAHCDIPCGIYDPISAQMAAMSVARFLDQLAALGSPKEPADLATLARLTAEKETHAESVKHEIVVIWGDYFKPAHFNDHPDLHDLAHQILRTASACKQQLDPNNGPVLVDLVNRFATVFWKTKGVATETVTAPYEPHLPVVRAAGN